MRTKYSIKNSITSVISNIISFLFLFITKTVLIKILGTEYNGLNGLFSNILTILGLLELGVGSAVTYSLYKYVSENDQKHIKSILFFYKKAYRVIALCILIFGILVIPFLKYIIKNINIDINVYIVYFLFLISTVSTYILSYKRNLIFVYQRKYIINIIHIFYVIVLNTIQILIILFTKNYYLFLIVKIICIILENIIISIKANKDYPFILDKNIMPLDENIKKSITDRVKALFIHKTAGCIANGTDNIIISAFIGIKCVGIYTNYNYIIYTVTLMLGDFISAASASVGNLLTVKDQNKTYSVFKKISFLNSWLSVFVSSCLLVLIEPFITIWLGKNFLLDRDVLIILVVNYYITMMRSSYNIFKDSAGIWIEDRFVPIFQVSINMISSIILVRLIGLKGVFLGTIISALALWLYSYPKFVFKKIFNRNYKEYFIRIIKNSLIFCLILIITYYICSLVIVKSILVKLLLNFVVCLFVTNFALYFIYGKTDEFSYFYKLIKKLVKRIRKERY